MIALAAMGLAGCGSKPDKQWYKPGGSYTMAEFDRDRKACTKGGDVDESCLKERGWFSISPDRDAPVSKEPTKRY